MEKIKALLVKPNELPLEIELHNTLKAKEKLVGGLIEVAYLNNTKEDICLICNENAKIENLPINRFLGNQFIYGDFLVVGDAYETGDFKSLSKKQIKYYQNYFGKESIEKTTSRIIARKLANSLFRRR